VFCVIRAVDTLAARQGRSLFARKRLAAPMNAENTDAGLFSSGGAIYLRVPRQVRGRGSAR